MKIGRGLLTGVLGLAITGCAGMAVPIPGGLYAKVQTPQTGISDAADLKTGTAECESILGWIAVGDCSIEAAKKNGGITKVQYSDMHSKNILGVYATYTTVVKGQ